MRQRSKATLDDLRRAIERTNAIAFAKAWDRVAFRGARRARDTRARRASAGVR